VFIDTDEECRVSVMLICVSVVVFAEMFSGVRIGDGYSIVVPAHSTLT
jgi:hypothetical protein